MKDQMVHIKIANLNDLTIQNNDNSKTLLTILQENYIDWMHACGAKGRCTTCKCIVKSGIEHFGGLTQPEINFKNMGRLNDNERLTCQTRIVKGEVEIEVPESSKLPHMDYSY
ncbi:2Fe-2S iron-sulfur cluster-binding protein [Fulvivirga sp.]|uniref:2Fe-2S iron-sulfur cluster-binding protein n=1 Tax=Fulvivirga sp. TaxID=1931237 RepID=UPI0032EE4BA0